jgi:predicted metal-dependent peptidase
MTARSLEEAARAIREDLKDIRAALGGKKAPFLSSLLARPKVVVTTGVETAGTDIDGTIYINPEFWGKLDFVGKAYVASHEIFHAALVHPWREQAKLGEDPRYHEVFNIAADALVYYFLQGFIKCPPVEKEAVSPELVSKWTEVPADQIVKMSVEEVFDLLLKKAKKVKVSVFLSGDIVPKKGPDGTVAQDGDPVLGGAKSKEEQRRLWKDFMTQAYTVQRTAGDIPEGIKRLIDSLLKPKFDPRTLLRQAVREGLGKTVAQDWQKRSRRYRGLPGIKRFTVPKIFALVDASGSISEQDLRLELGTIYKFAGVAEVEAVSFDTEAYEFVKGKRPSEVITKIAGKIRGGGGTCIERALAETLKRMRNKDVVSILSDGEIFDLEQDRVKQLLAQVAHRASVCFFALVTDKELQIPGWRVIHLHPHNSV